MYKYSAFLVFLLTMLTSLHLSGQVGVTVGYNIHLGADDWDVELSGDEKVKSDGIMLNLDYWFRLKNYRIEFLPEVGIVLGEHDVQNVSGEGIATSYNQLSFFLNTSVYPFDFEGDCNCPTFGKDGSFFQKGFYLQVSPGISYLSSKTEYQVSGVSHEGSKLNFALGIGTGLDIGLTDYLTITPLIRYVLGFGSEWSGIHFTGAAATAVESNTRDLQTGIRITYRLDYKQSRF